MLNRSLSAGFKQTACVLFQNLKEELAIVTSKLEQVTNEKKEMHGLWQKLQKEYDQAEKLRMDHDKVLKERDLLRTEGVRLKHRISYLEEQVRLQAPGHRYRS